MAKKENINNTIYTKGAAMPGKLSGAPTVMNNGVSAEDAMGSQAMNAYGQDAVNQYMTDKGIYAGAPEAVMYGQAVHQYGKEAVDDFVSKRYDYYANLGAYYQQFIPPQSNIDWGVVRAQNIADRERFNRAGDEGVVRAALAGEYVRRLVEQKGETGDKALDDRLTLVSKKLNMDRSLVSQSFTPEEINMYALYDYFERNMADEQLPVSFLRSAAAQGLSPKQFDVMREMVLKTSPIVQQLMEKDAYDRGVALQTKLNEDAYNIFYRTDENGNYIEPTAEEARQVSDNQFISQYVSEGTTGFWDTTKFMIGSLVSLVSDTMGDKKYREAYVSEADRELAQRATDFLAANYPKSTENPPLPSSMMGIVGGAVFHEMAFAPQRQAMQMLSVSDDLKAMGLLWSVPTDQAFMAELAHDVAKNPQVKWSQVLKQTADARALVTALTMFADVGTMFLGLAGKTVSGSIGKAFLRKTLGDYMTSGARRGAERFLTSTAGRGMVDFAGGAMDAALILQGAQGATGYSAADARMQLMGAEDERMEAFFRGITTNFLTNLGIGAVFNSPSLIPVGASMIANMYHGMRDASIVANKLTFTAEGRALVGENSVESVARAIDDSWKTAHPNEDGNLYIWSGDLSKVLREAEEQGVPLTPQQRRYILEPDFERVADLYDDVSITLGDFAAHFEGTPLGELMKKHLRGTPTSRSRAQFLADQQEFQKILNSTLNNEAAAQEFVRLAGMAPSRGLRRMLERSAIRAGYLEETFPHTIGDVAAFTRLTGRYEELFPTHPAYNENWLKGEQDAVLAESQAAEASRARTASLSEQTRLASFDSRDMMTPEWQSAIAQSQAATQGTVARIESERATRERMAREHSARLSEASRLSSFDTRDMFTPADQEVAARAALAQRNEMARLEQERLERERIAREHSARLSEQTRQASFDNRDMQVEVGGYARADLSSRASFYEQLRKQSYHNTTTPEWRQRYEEEQAAKHSGTASEQAPAPSEPRTSTQAEREYYYFGRPEEEARQKVFNDTKERIAQHDEFLRTSMPDPNAERVEIKNPTEPIQYPPSTEVNWMASTAEREAIYNPPPEVQVVDEALRLGFTGSEFDHRPAVDVLREYSRNHPHIEELKSGEGLPTALREWYSNKLLQVIESSREDLALYRDFLDSFDIAVDSAFKTDVEGLTASITAEDLMKRLKAHDIEGMSTQQLLYVIAATGLKIRQQIDADIARLMNAQPQLTPRPLETVGQEGYLQGNQMDYTTIYNLEDLAQAGQRVRSSLDASREEFLNSLGVDELEALLEEGDAFGFSETEIKVQQQKLDTRLKALRRLVEKNAKEEAELMPSASATVDDFGFVDLSTGRRIAELATERQQAEAELAHFGSQFEANRNRIEAESAERLARSKAAQEARIDQAKTTAEMDEWGVVDTKSFVKQERKVAKAKAEAKRREENLERSRQLMQYRIAQEKAKKEARAKEELRKLNQLTHYKAVQQQATFAPSSMFKTVENFNRLMDENPVLRDAIDKFYGTFAGKEGIVKGQPDITVNQWFETVLSRVAAGERKVTKQSNNFLFAHPEVREALVKYINDAGFDPAPRPESVFEDLVLARDMRYLLAEQGYGSDPYVRRPESEPTQSREYLREDTIQEGKAINPDLVERPAVQEAVANEVIDSYAEAMESPMPEIRVEEEPEPRVHKFKEQPQVETPEVIQLGGTDTAMSVEEVVARIAEEPSSANELLRMYFANIGRSDAAVLPSDSSVQVPLNSKTATPQDLRKVLIDGKLGEVYMRQHGSNTHGASFYQAAEKAEAANKVLYDWQQAAVTKVEAEAAEATDIAMKVNAAFESRVKTPYDNVDALDPVRDAALESDLRKHLEQERLAGQHDRGGVAQEGNIEAQQLMDAITGGEVLKQKYEQGRALLQMMRDAPQARVREPQQPLFTADAMADASGVYRQWDESMRQTVASLVDAERVGEWKSPEAAAQVIVSEMMRTFTEIKDMIDEGFRNIDISGNVPLSAAAAKADATYNSTRQMFNLVKAFNETFDDVSRFMMNRDIDGMLAALLVRKDFDRRPLYGVALRNNPDLDSISKGSLYNMMLRGHTSDLGMPNPAQLAEGIDKLDVTPVASVKMDTLINTMARVLTPEQLQVLSLATNFRATERLALRDMHQQMLAYRSSLMAIQDAMDLQIGSSGEFSQGFINALSAKKQMGTVAWHNASLDMYKQLKRTIDRDFDFSGLEEAPVPFTPREEPLPSPEPKAKTETESPVQTTEPVLDQEVKADINPELPAPPDDALPVPAEVASQAEIGPAQVVEEPAPAPLVEEAPSNIDTEQPPMHSLSYRDNETVQQLKPEVSYNKETKSFDIKRAPTSQRSTQGSKRGTVAPDYQAMNERIQVAAVKKEPFELFRNQLYSEMMTQGINLDKTQANHVLNHAAQIFDSMAESLGMSIDDFIGNGKFNVSFKFVDNPRDFRMKQAGSDVISQGEFDPKTFTIYLKQEPNILEFTHELAHYWTQMYFQAPLEAHIKAKANPRALERMQQEQAEILAELGYEGKTWNQLSGLDKNRVQERVVKGYLNSHAMESATVMDTDHMNMLTNYAQFDRAMARGAVDSWNTREVGDTWENAVIRAVAKDTDEFQKLYGDYLGEVKGDKEKFFGSEIYNSVMNHYAFDNELAKYQHTVQGYSKLNIEDVAYLKDNVAPMIGEELKNREAYISTLENFDEILGSLEGEGYMGKAIVLYNKIQDANKFFKEMADKDVEVMAQRANISHWERELDRIRKEIAVAKASKLDTKALQQELKIAQDAMRQSKAQLKDALKKVKQDMSRIKKTMTHWKAEYEEELTNARVLFHNQESPEYRRWHANDLLTSNMKQFGQKLSLTSLENARVPRYITTNLVEKGLAGADGNMSLAEFTKAYVDGRDMRLGVAKLRELSEHEDLDSTITRFAQRKIEMKKNTEEVMANLMQYVVGYEVGKLQKALKIRAAPDDPTDFRSLITQVSRSVSNDIGNIKYNELTPRKFLFKATFARRQAFEALKKRDTKAAFMALLSSATFIERAKRAGQVKAELDKQIKTVREIYNGRRASIADTYDADTFASGVVLLNAIGLTRRNDIAARRIELMRYNPEATKNLELTLNNLRAQGKIYYYTEMPSGDLRVVLDAAKRIATDAKEIKQYGDNFARELRMAHREEVTETLETENKGKFETEDKSYLGDTKNTRSSLSRVMDAIKQSRFRSWPMESILEYIEASTDGPLKRHIFNPVKQAEDLYHQDLTVKAKALRSISDRLDKLDDELKQARGKATVSIEGSTYNGKRERVPHTWELGSTGRLRYDLFGIMLNMGNDSNIARVATSLGVTERDLHNFVHDWQAQGYINDRMWDLAQEVWDLFDEVDLRNQKVYYNLNGHYYEFIQPKRLISYSGKEYKGGYVPLTVLHDEPIKLDINNTQAYLREGFPTDPKFAQGRVEHDYLLDLSFVAVAQGMQRELAFGHMMEPVLKAHRLLEHSQVKAMLDNLVPDLSTMMTDWLVDMANGRPTAMINMSEAQKLANMACTNVTTSMMMGNVVNALMTAANFAPALTRVRPAYLFKSVAGIAKTDWIAKQSVFMANRWAQMGSNMDTTISRMKSRNPIARGSKWLSDHAYFLQIYTQRYMDAWVWDGAFNDFIATNPKDYEGAVAHADQVVRTTQGSFELSGRSAASRDSSLVAALTPFTGYFNTMEALMRSTNRMWNKHETSRLRMAMNMALSATLVTVIPALISQAILSFLAGDIQYDKKDDKSVLADMLLAPFKQYTMQFNPYVGALFNTFVARATGTSDFGIGRIPALTQLNTSAASVGKLIAAMMDDSKSTTYKDWVGALAFLSLINPVFGPLSREGKVLDPMLKGYDDSVWDMLRAVITMRQSPDMRAYADRFN